MEIHHHPKHSEKPRKYKEYVFEFLVIFVAITGSFFAENLREHFVDSHKEKEYNEIRAITGYHEFFISSQKMFISCGFQEQRKMKGDLFKRIEFSKRINKY